MSRDKIEFEGSWVLSGPTMRRLWEAGYGVSVSTTKEDRPSDRVYILARLNERHAAGEIILEAKTPDELNNFVRLLLPPET